MVNRIAVLLCAVSSFAAAVIAAPATPTPVRPGIGKPIIMREAEVRPGMKGVAWTVFSGTQPEAVPVEILGIEKNLWGPHQDIILGKMGGQAIRTNVAGGMSGSPVYVDGKLIGAVSLRLSVFSPDAICGITPIELMLEVNQYDDSRPSEARTPGKQNRDRTDASVGVFPQMVPIETPLAFAGFGADALTQFGSGFQQAGFTTVAGGGTTSTLRDAKPAADWKTSLKPGDAVSAVLVSGDMSITGMCTVTYNDGQHVLACGHSIFNLGPVDMPMAKSDVVMTLASAFQPNKIGNATEIEGALRQDRHSAIMGELGAAAEMVPVDLKVRSFDESNSMRSEKDLKFSVFVQQKWTPYLMMVTLFNAVSSLNEFADEATYRLSGQVELEGEPNIKLNTMLAPSELPVPAPMQLAGWWGEKFTRLFLNPVQMPKLRSVNVTLDLLPDRRIAEIQNAWVPNSEVEPGSEVPVKVFVQPYRGDRIEREFTVKIPANLPRGPHTILFSDADTLNHMQSNAAMSDEHMDIPQTVSLINQERRNDRLYVSLLEAGPTVFYEDKTMPSLPPSIMNVMQTGRTASRRLVSSAENVVEQGSIPFDLVVDGSYALRIQVK
ncbi:MAG: hypothetical protein ABSB67_13580 [Bryobacteraceae bacterium]|jgi:hypothetical protein